MDRAFLHLVRGSCHPERDHRFREGFPRYLPSNPPPAPPASLQSTYSPPLSATGTSKMADNEACKSNDFNAVAAVADRSRKIRKNWRRQPTPVFLVHPRNSPPKSDETGRELLRRKERKQRNGRQRARRCHPARSAFPGECQGAAAAPQHKMCAE